MLFLFVICNLFLAIYLVYQVSLVAKEQVQIAASIKTELTEIRSAQRIQPSVLPYGWFDDGWPIEEEKEWRTQLENPTPHRSPDAYVTQMFVAEYGSILDPRERKEFLRQLFREGVWMEPELLDVIYADENPFVRAWAASHLATDYKDYSDRDSQRQLRDYEPALLLDTAPIVRAALWSNPQCNRLPWSLIWISEAWKEQIQKMSHIERLGLMRNPELSMKYVVALLEASTEELRITKQEHVEIVSAAAVNPHLIGGSRRTGRRAWIGGDEGNPPFEEYGKMWELCLEKWINHSPVPFLFLKYIQTTPKVKLAAYNQLFEKPERSDYTWLRQEVIRSCDPFDDGVVLKLAWNDPDDECRKIARERVGKLTQYVGVKD